MALVSLIQGEGPPRPVGTARKEARRQVPPRLNTPARQLFAPTLFNKRIGCLRRRGFLRVRTAAASPVRLDPIPRPFSRTAEGTLALSRAQGAA